MAAKMRRIAALAGIIACFAIMISGCGIIKDLITGGGPGEAGEVSVQTDANLAPENITGDKDTGNDGKDTAAIVNPYEVTLYFASPDGNSLAPEVRTIEKVEGVARAAMFELIEGPSPGSGLLPTLPQGTSLLDINVKDDGLCIVDFSSELLGDASGEVITGELMVYSIVNTLTEFPTIDSVEFRIEGQPVERLGDNIPASAPLTADPTLISN